MDARTMQSGASVDDAGARPAAYLASGQRTWAIDQEQPQRTFGRATSNDVVVGDAYASRHHGMVLLRRGRLVLLDASTNGTLVVYASGLTVSVHREAVALEGRGSIRLGRWEGKAFGFLGCDDHFDVPQPRVACETTADAGCYRRDGARWTIAYAGHAMVVTDTPGLGYVAQLLAHPNVPLDPLDLFLAAGESGVPAGGQASMLQEPDAARRARRGVSARIKRTLRRLRYHHPRLGHLLTERILVDTRCVYRPDASHPIAWTF